MKTKVDFYLVDIRLVYGMMFHAELNNLPGMLLLLDFATAFDSVSWDFMFKALTYFNFGGQLISWIKLFYTNIESCVIINGHLSD